MMPKLKRILCPVDFSEFSTRAYRFALSVASHYRAELFVQHVIELWRYPCLDFAASGELVDEFCQKLRKKVDEDLQQLVTTYAHNEVQTERVVQQETAPEDCILGFAKDQSVDLIVMGTHGRRGFDRLMLGSVTERVMRKSSCPVLTVNKPSHDFVGPDQLLDPLRLNRILFCTDFSENSRRALDLALSLTAEYEAELTLLHVLDDAAHAVKIQRVAATTELLDRLVPPEMCKSGKGKIHTMVRIGKPYHQISQSAAEAHTDLVIMAVRGRGAALDFAVFGSTTYRVLQLGPCPVLAIHV